MSAPIHTQECLEAQAARKAWEARYPNYCKECLGNGGFYDPGTYWDPPDFGPCSSCWEQNICPRCGHAEAFEPDAFTPPCLYCGWYDSPESSPPAAECICPEPDYSFDLDW